MTRYGHIVWRVIAVMAFAGTAALAVTLTRAPVRERSALSSDSSVSTCAASGLEERLGRGRPAPGAREAGGGVYTLEFTNVSGRPCGLFGYPDVSAYAGGQGKIGVAAAHDASVRPRPVVLEPGATAHSVLRVGPRSCERVVAPELRVVLPRASRPAFVRARVPVCSRKGAAFMSARPIQARPGAPGDTAS